MRQIPRAFIISLMLAAALSPACRSITPEIGQAPQVTAANEIAAQARLHSIAAAEAQYMIEADGEYATLDQLVAKAMLIDPSRGKLHGYKFEVRTKPNGFEATAVPENAGITGRRSFYVDQTNVIRGADKGGAPANASDPPL